MNLGKAIKMCRTQRDMSLKDLARAAQVSTSYLSLLERNKRDPNMKTVERIGAALKVPLPVLVFLAHEPGEIESISTELAEKLAHTALSLVHMSNDEAA